MKEIKENISIIENIISIIDKDVPVISNLANLSYVLKYYFKNTDWAGFYLTKNESLYLGPFQGDLACTVIPFNKGVCGISAYKKESVLVPDVHKFEGHIACSSSTNSEVVVPIIKDNQIVGVIDLDSNEFNNYSLEDVKILESIAEVIAKLF